MSDRESGLADAIKSVVAMSHVGRCMIQGCYYGTAAAERCIYCGGLRQPDAQVGRSVLQDLQEAVRK